MISSMILQLDFLQNHLPCDKVAGILVFDAHRLSPGCVELFCLLLFRHRCHGFVKCFSDNANACWHRISPALFVFERADRSLSLSVPPQRDTVIAFAQQVPECNRASSLAIPYRWRSAPSPTTSGCWQAPSTPLTPRSRSRASSSSWATSSASSTSCTAT